MFMAAIGEKLTGEQLRDCIEDAGRRYSDQTVTAAQLRIGLWIMDGEDMAEHYQYERSGALERMDEARRKLEWAWSAITKQPGWGDRGTIRAQLNDALRSIERIATEYDSALKTVTEALETGKKAGVQ